MESVWRRRRPRDAWIAAVPLAFYAVWWLAYQDTGLVRGNLALAPAFAADAAAGALGALAGLTEPPTEATDAINDNGATFAWGRPLAVAAAFVLAWRLAVVRPVSPRLLALLAMALTFWLLTGLQRAHLASPDSSRYLYVGALFVVLACVELARGASLGRVPAVVLACAAGLIVVSNLGDLRAGAAYLRSQAAAARADLGALELARTQVPAGYVATSFPGTPFILVRADRYFAAAAANGTPAFSPAEIAFAPEPARGTADAELTSIHRVALRPGRTGAKVGAAPAVEAAAGGAAATRGACVRFRPAQARPVEPAAHIELKLPRGGIELSASGGPATVSVRRFAAGYPEKGVGQLAASGSGVLRIEGRSCPAALARPGVAPGRRDRMRPALTRWVQALAAACLLGGPTVLAFRAGGYYTESLLIGAIVAWSLVLALALAGPSPLPRSRPGWLALAGLALLTAWSALSIAWAPLGGPALHQVQRLVLYLGALLLAYGGLRSRRALRAAEPALAAGATIVIVYGLAGRLLPGIIELSRSRRAGGRLEQPLTYWNGEGALAAIGFVLCARLAGDRSRPAAVRAAAAAAAVPLGAGVYLSYSRGAIAVALLGLVVLVAAAPTHAQLRAAAIALAGGAASAIAAAAFPGVAALEGTRGDRVADGAGDAGDPRAAVRRRRGTGGARRRPARRAAAGSGPPRPGRHGARRRRRRRARRRRARASARASLSSPRAPRPVA